MVGGGHWGPGKVRGVVPDEVMVALGKEGVDVLGCDLGGGWHIDFDAVLRKQGFVMCQQGE